MFKFICICNDIVYADNATHLCEHDLMLDTVFVIRLKPYAYINITAFFIEHI